MSQFSMTNKVKEHIGVHYLLTEIRLSTLIHLELKLFLKDISLAHNRFRI